MSPASRLSPLDLALVAAYLVGITLFGLRFRGKADKSLRGYFLAGQTIPWWAIALSIVSAETSTLTIIGVPAASFAGDFGFLQIVIGYMVGRVLVAILFLPRYFAGNMLTAYQLIHQRFGPALHKTTAILFLFVRAAAEGVRVFAISIVVSIAIGTGDTLSIALISLLTLLYTFEGGMAAVVWTDVVQMAIYIGGTLIALGTLGSHVQGGWSAVHTLGAAAGKFHLFHFALNLTDNYTFWAGVLGGTFLTMASHGTDQLMVQRLLAARNLRQSTAALLSSGLVIFFQFALFLLIGVGLFAFYTQHPHTFANGNRIFPTFIVQQMPRGIAGLLIAAILAAAMSNLSAALNSLSSTTVVDLWLSARPSAGEQERERVARGSTVFWALVLFSIALYSVHAGGRGNVVEIGLSIASVAYGALLGVFLLGTLNRHATQGGAIVGMIVGFTLNVALWLQPHAVALGPVTLPRVAFTWYVLIGSAVTFAVGSLASLILRDRRHAAALAALLLFATTTLRAQTPEAAKPDFHQLDTLINDAIAARKLPGAVLVIGHSGRIAYQKAYGQRAQDPRPEPMTEDTIFDMASLSKCLSTATAVMQLYEAGKLQFDDPLVKFLPEFATSADGKPDPRRAQVTIRMLLTHTSGEAPDLDLSDPWGLATPDHAEGIRRALSNPLQSNPGSIFRYSDINYILLGHLVEKLSGEPLDVYAQTHIFEPLHMDHTRYHPFAKACGPFQQVGSSIVPGGPDHPCIAGSWSTTLATGGAPTTHDAEGTPSTNPDFDQMLRGTVHDPTTRRMGGVAGQAGVFSTAHDISLYAQALLDRLAGRPSDFPLKQSTLELMTSPEQPGHSPADLTQIPAGTTVTYPSRKGHDVRGYGWDIDTAFSRPRGVVFPIGSFGHTGYTGTTLWMDPGSDTYVVLLTNAVHPRDRRGGVTGLRGDVATAAARALSLYPERASATAAPYPSHAQVDTGIDVLELTHFTALREAAARHGGHLRLGLLTNQTGLDHVGRRTIDVLHTDAAQAVPGLQLVTLFSPEHGIAGTHDLPGIQNSVDDNTGLPVHSLFGAKPTDRRPSPADLQPLDAVLIDLQDAGVRFYTYETVTGYFVEAAARQPSLDLIVLDRPSLIDGTQVQGPTSDPGLESYTDFMPLPVRHGLTLGELARFFAGEKLVDGAHLSAAHVSVVPVEGWQRNQLFDQTGIPWVNPSPNLRSQPAALLYPGLGFLETTNLSVGRGTDSPFLVFGAGTKPGEQPWFDPAAVIARLQPRNLPGVTFHSGTLPVTDDPNHYPFHGQTIPVVRLEVTDPHTLDSPRLGIEILAALHALYPTQFQLSKASRLIANAQTMQALEQGTDPATIAAAWVASLQSFQRQREPYLLYR